MHDIDFGHVVHCVNLMLMLVSVPFVLMIVCFVLLCHRANRMCLNLYDYWTSDPTAKVYKVAAVNCITVLAMTAIRGLLLVPFGLLCVGRFVRTLVVPVEDFEDPCYIYHLDPEPPFETDPALLEPPMEEEYEDRFVLAGRLWRAVKVMFLLLAELPLGLIDIGRFLLALVVPSDSDEFDGFPLEPPMEEDYEERSALTSRLWRLMKAPILFVAELFLPE